MLSKVIEVRLDNRNTQFPILVTLSGMVIEVRLEQLVETAIPILVTLSGNKLLRLDYAIVETLTPKQTCNTIGDNY